jgi:hypothetical protein
MDSYLKLSGVSSIQPHFHFVVSNESSYFKEQESSALPTELTTHAIDSSGKGETFFAETDYSNFEFHCPKRQNYQRFGKFCNFPEFARSVFGNLNA